MAELKLTGEQKSDVLKNVEILENTLIDFHVGVESNLDVDELAAITIILVEIATLLNDLLEELT